jgi:hypothetical protein
VLTSFVLCRSPRKLLLQRLPESDPEWILLVGKLVYEITAFRVAAKGEVGVQGRVPAVLLLVGGLDEGAVVSLV